jgi:septum formation protein
MNLTYPLILGSKSPRRKEILQKAGFDFTVESTDLEELYPADLPHPQVAEYLARLKAEAFQSKTQYENKIILTADTTVQIDGMLLEKPLDGGEAFEMLKRLSGKRHEVISGFAVLVNDELVSASDKTSVFFNELPDTLISSYIKTHKPFDKAGAYGIQEGLGLTHIERLEGSYFNVMGLPIHRVYQKLEPYIIK